MRDAADIERTMGAHAHADAVWRACLVHLPASDAEDVFQETFLKYALHDEPFRDDAHARAWLLRVAINGCKDALRAARRRDVSLDERVERLGDRAVDVEAPSELGCARCSTPCPRSGTRPGPSSISSCARGIPRAR